MGQEFLSEKVKLIVQVPLQVNIQKVFLIISKVFLIDIVNLAVYDEGCDD